MKVGQQVTLPDGRTGTIAFIGELVNVTVDGLPEYYPLSTFKAAAIKTEKAVKPSIKPSIKKTATPAAKKPVKAKP